MCILCEVVNELSCVTHLLYPHKEQVHLFQWPFFYFPPHLFLSESLLKSAMSTCRCHSSHVSNGVMSIIHTEMALTDEAAHQCWHFFLFLPSIISRNNYIHFLASASPPRVCKCGCLRRLGCHLRSSRRGEMIEEDHRRGL